VRPRSTASIRDVEAHGKHLFYRFVANGWATAHDLSLHVHLGLFGRFRQYGEDPRTPTGGHAAGAVDRGRAAAAREADRM
jgi:formamidopyrimidine-DNA glycosylase